MCYKKLFSWWKTCVIFLSNLCTVYITKHHMEKNKDPRQPAKPRMHRMCLKFAIVAICSYIRSHVFCLAPPRPTRIIMFMQGRNGSRPYWFNHLGPTDFKLYVPCFFIRKKTIQGWGRFVSWVYGFRRAVDTKCCNNFNRKSNNYICLLKFLCVVKVRKS